MVKFRVIIRGHNCQDYLHHCLKALIKQTFPKWKATVILDAPKDDSVSIAKKYARRDKRIKVFVNKKRLGVAANIWKGIALAEAKDEDVIAIYDSDDRLSKDALETVAKEYAKNPKLLITYGSFWRTDKKKKTKTSKPYNKRKNIRKQPWHGSHLKTFKHKLYKHYKKEWLQDKNGNWYQAASDIALMFPLFEMAGFDRTKHIKKCIYKWNRTPYKTRGHEQARNKKELRKRKPVRRLKDV